MSLSTQTECHVETVDTRSVQKVIGSHKFKIMGYSWDKDLRKGEALVSKIFSVGGYNWVIEYYPNGAEEAADNNISVFLRLESISRHVKAQVSFAISDLSGNALPISRSTNITTFDTLVYPPKRKGPYIYRSGFMSFTTKEKLESTMKDDCFVIKSVVSVFKVLPVKSTEPIVVPPKNITQQLCHLLETGNGADITFEVNGTTFNAHRCILAARSSVFLAQFLGPLKEKTDAIIKIDEMEAPVFKLLLHFIYDDCIPEFEEKESSKEQGTRSMAQHLLVAADRYGLERLKIICQKFLYDTIDISNVASMLSLADRHNCVHLKKACLNFLISADKIGEFIDVEEFQQVVKNDPFILKELLEKRG